MSADLPSFLTTDIDQFSTIMESSSLQSDDHRFFLDSVDELRSKGFSNYVDLPQIIVCGDQSAGKSSVLNAVSGMSFPAKDNLCTRFATELILRRTNTAGVKVSIIPSQDRSEEEAQELQSFSAEIDVNNPDIGPVVEQAKVAMGISDVKRFSTDILRVELSGPKQPHLTLVDLPGLFRAGSKDQSVDDAGTVSRLVRQSMERPRSIILVVVSAKSDFNLQDVTELAREIDPDGKRTMGLITKPDTLDAGSDSESSYIKLARNEDVSYQLGWHVLKNRSYEMRNASAAERDEDEEKFFQMGVWASVDQRILGVTTLKERLSQVLTGQILAQLPNLLQEVEAEVSKRKASLDRLGPARGTTGDQRRYLYKVTQRFSDLMKSAVDGVYNDPFFLSASEDEGYHRRLRAVVQNNLIAFEDDMRKNGQTHVLEEDQGSDQKMTSPLITRSDYIDKVKALMNRSRGRELPGTFDPLVIGELFREQCMPWRSIAIRAKDTIVEEAIECAQVLVKHVAVDVTADAMMRKIEAEFAVIRSNLDRKLDELLEPHRESHPITYNHYLTDTVRKAQSERRNKRLMEILGEEWDKDELNLTHIIETLNGGLQSDMASHAAELATDYMLAYHEVARKTFIDDVSALAIEATFIRHMPKLFTPEMVHDLTDEEANVLAGESKDSIAERVRSSQELKILEDGLRNLRKLDRHRATMKGIYDKDISGSVTCSNKLTHGIKAATL